MYSVTQRVDELLSTHWYNETTCQFVPFADDYLEETRLAACDRTLKPFVTESELTAFGEWLTNKWDVEP